MQTYSRKLYCNLKASSIERTKPTKTKIKQNTFTYKKAIADSNLKWQRHSSNLTDIKSNCSLVSQQEKANAMEWNRKLEWVRKDRKIRRINIYLWHQEYLTKACFKLSNCLNTAIDAVHGRVTKLDNKSIDILQ